MKHIQLISIASISLLLAACGGGSSQVVEPEPTAKPIEQPAAEVEKKIVKKTGPLDEKAQVEVIPQTNETSLTQQSLESENISSQDVATPAEPEESYDPIVYFGYDDSSVTEEAMQTIQFYADYLAQNPKENLRLVGHTDERGTPEYNLALGEKRAKSVEEAFMLYGVGQARIDVITMGEEMPAVDAHNENAWAQNRRVEILIQP